jgi:hypothetical protein
MKIYNSQYNVNPSVNVPMVSLIPSIKPQEVGVTRLSYRSNHSFWGALHALGMFIALSSDIARRPNPV